MKPLKKLIVSALMLALAFVLPFFTGQIPQIGSMLCPMHIPVLLCGFFCGWQYGLAVGLLAPILRSLFLGMPPLFPTAFAMMFELGVYGCLSGLMYAWLPKKPLYVYVSLITAMIAGRLVWGAVMYAVSIASASVSFGAAAFLAGAFINAIPGIIIQIVLIPILVITLSPLLKRSRQA